MAAFLPVVLESIGTNRHQYLLLAALKEIILVHATQGLNFNPFLDSVLPGLLSTSLRYLMSCYVMLYYVMSCYVMSCHVMLCNVMSCYVILCYDMLCHVILCYDMLCHVILCHVM